MGRRTLRFNWHESGREGKRHAGVTFETVQPFWNQGWQHDNKLTSMSLTFQDHYCIFRHWKSNFWDKDKHVARTFLQEIRPVRVIRFDCQCAEGARRRDRVVHSGVGSDQAARKAACVTQALSSKKLSSIFGRRRPAVRETLCFLSVFMKLVVVFESLNAA